MLGDCGKLPYRLALDGYEGLGWIVGFTIYDEDEYVFDDGYSRVWLDKDCFEDVFDNLTTEAIAEILIEHAESRYREGYSVDLFPIEAEFADRRWNQVNDPEPTTYIFNHGEWTKSLMSCNV